MHVDTYLQASFTTSNAAQLAAREFLADRPEIDSESGLYADTDDEAPVPAVGSSDVADPASPAKADMF